MAEQTANLNRKNHILNIENRGKLTIDGIGEVKSYDSTAVLLGSDWGDIVIRGENLHIITFDRAGGKLLCEGTVDSISYLEVQKSGESFFSRLLK
ncbi:MAG: YabP/YqfC family sporulation protein [Oscillospiraceae bacterium]